MTTKNLLSFPHGGSQSTTMKSLIVCGEARQTSRSLSDETRGIKDFALIFEELIARVYNQDVF